MDLALGPIHMPSPAPFERVTFDAWTIGEDGLVKPEEIFGEHSSVETIAARMACEGAFGHTVAVRETDSVADKATVHFYRIRRGKWLGRYDSLGARRVYPYYADPLFKLQVKSFDPREPWRWTPGCDVVGRDPGIIDMRASS